MKSHLRMRKMTNRPENHVAVVGKPLVEIENGVKILKSLEHGIHTQVLFFSSDFILFN